MSDPDGWDVAVVGAGPAGAVVARQLARLGVRVLLLDQAMFPRRKVCGGCLNRLALSALASVGLGEVPARLGGVPLASATLAAGGRTATVSLPGGVSVSREALDVALIDRAVGEGVTFRHGVRARADSLTPNDNRLNVGGETLRARVVIDATGLNGRLTNTDVTVRPGSRIGAGTVFDSRCEFFRPGTIYMATGRGGYVGLVRVEGGRLDVAAAFDAGFVRGRGSLAAAAERTILEAGFPVPIELPAADWKGTPPLTRTPARVAGPGWFAVGDAAGYVEPFTGEGMAWGVAGAVTLAPIVARAVRQWDDRIVHEWTAAHHSLLGRRQLLCRLTARVLRSPFASRMLVRGLGGLPGLARPFVGALNRPIPPL